MASFMTSPGLHRILALCGKTKWPCTAIGTTGEAT